MINTKRTKIVCTIGPATKDVELLKRMMVAGMNVARLNFSHGSFEDQEVYYNAVKEAREAVGLPVAILLDTQGPEIRTGKLVENPVILKAEDTFTLVNDDIVGDNTKASITYKELYLDVEAGTTILIDDGKIELEVQRIEGKDIVCKVMNGGALGNSKSINVPGRHINLPALKDKDIKDLIDACKYDFDFIAASFIRSAEDVRAIKKVLAENGGEKIKIISKIESQEGVNNVDSILEVTDAIMVARGDMGVEIPIEKVPIIQKSIIKKCNKAGKVVITATQMLDSMIRNSLPTRAEASDICNAIFDGTDAIMLSGESASGNFPIEAAQTMARIAQETEANLEYDHLLKQNLTGIESSYADAISYSACKTSVMLDAKAIVAATKSGATAKLLSKYRPKAPILAITPYDYVRRNLNLNFGVFPKQCELFNTTDEILSEARKFALQLNDISTGDNIIVAAGMPTTQTGGTNMLKIEKL